ncbi:MAG: hypothetical protein ACRDUS_05260 [Mycobacterium sp.]
MRVIIAIGRTAATAAAVMLIGSGLVTAIASSPNASAAPECPPNMTYDMSMDLCVPSGMSFDSSFSPPLTECGTAGTPKICRGPLPRPPHPPTAPAPAPNGGKWPGRYGPT